MSEQIQRTVNGSIIQQRPGDGFIDGTAMAVAHSKKIDSWFRTQETLGLFQSLANDLGFKYADLSNLDVARLSGSKYSKLFPDIIYVKRGSPETGGGTWLHPDLAIQLAQWCSPAFALQVSRWVREWLVTETQRQQKDSIIKACILPTPTLWQKRFSKDYYDHLSRLTGLKQRGNKRPQLWGQLTNELVYDCLPTGVAEALKQCRSDSNGWEKLHQFLSPEGLRIFENHMRQLLSLMLAASSLEDLRRLMQASITRSYQLLLF